MTSVLRVDAGMGDGMPLALVLFAALSGFDNF